MWPAAKKPKIIENARMIAIAASCVSRGDHNGRGRKTGTCTTTVDRDSPGSSTSGQIARKPSCLRASSSVLRRSAPFLVDAGGVTIDAAAGIAAAGHSPTGRPELRERQPLERGPRAKAAVSFEP